MTAQFSDNVFFNGTEYSIIGVNGGDLFDPHKIGFKQTGFSTACYSGYYCTYSITDNKLLLKDLTLYSKDRKLIVNGKKPKISQGNAFYSAVELPILFTGILRLGTDFIDEAYVHMGFQKPTAYLKVIDLKLQDGILVSVKDRSSEVEEKRNSPPPIPKELTEWIEDRFSLDLEWD